jgi:hypothetical protein
VSSAEVELELSCSLLKVGGHSQVGMLELPFREGGRLKELPLRDGGRTVGAGASSGFIIKLSFEATAADVTEGGFEFLLLTTAKSWKLAAAGCGCSPAAGRPDTVRPDFTRRINWSPPILKYSMLEGIVLPVGGALCYAKE